MRLICVIVELLIINLNLILMFIYFRLVARDMDLPDDKKTSTLIKSATDESGEQFDTDLQDASKDICVPLSSFGHESLQISKIKEEVNADDCSLMMRIEKETEPGYRSTVHTAYCDEPHMDDQPNSALSLVHKYIKSESSEHIVHHHTAMDMTIYAQQHIETAPVVIDSEFSNSTTDQCRINTDTVKTGVSKSSTQYCPKLNHESDNLCHIEVFSAANVNQAKLSHTKVNPHVLPECGQQYGQNFHLNRHMFTDAEENRCFDIKITQTSRPTPHILTNSVECDNNCKQTDGLVQHMLVPVREEAYDCPECCESFDKKHHLKQHILTDTHKKQHACPDCDKRFTRAYHLKPHMLTHTGEKHHTCPDCDKRFTRAYDLKLHMLIHTGVKQHTCSDCNKRFTHGSALKRHMLIHTGEKQHACPDCDKRFTYASDLKRHMFIHTGEKKHACPDCDKRFTQAVHLKRHMLTHTGEKQNTCPDCDKRFTRTSHLKQHILIHTGVKQHTCPDCDKRFTRTSHLKQHMLIHTGVKQHSCPDCDKRFTRTSHLKQHMIIHTGEKQHACPDCERRFTHASDLKRHMLIHTGEKQHTCPDCDKRFTRTNHLKQHMLIHTGARQHIHMSRL